MRDRVHAALLDRSLERIGEICGRIVGAARRLQLDAAAAGQAPPDASTPCSLFGDPEALQALIDAERVPDPTIGSTAAADETAEPGEEPQDDGPVEITEFEYVGADFEFADEYGISHGGYFNPRYTFSVDGDTVSVELVFDYDRPWVEDETSVSCWAYLTWTYSGQATLARQMVFDLQFVGQSAPRLEGLRCAEFPYDAEGSDSRGEPIVLTVDIDSAGHLNGGVDVEGINLFVFE